MQTGYRRRILIEPAPGVATAELEDDYHRMVVRLHHQHGVVTRVESAMKRSPWTTCEGAMARLEETFSGVALADVVRRGEKSTNCTHLHDLAVFAAAHADEEQPVAYDIFVSDVTDGRREALLLLDGKPVLGWALQDVRIVAPAELAGRKLTELGDWIAAQDSAGAEAGRILRWAAIVGNGRAMDISAGVPATVFPAGTCYTFQPEQARISTRKPGADIDFSQPGMEPMADRSESFRKYATHAA